MPDAFIIEVESRTAVSSQGTSTVITSFQPIAPSAVSKEANSALPATPSERQERF
jgi:hypothetical protein